MLEEKASKINSPPKNNEIAIVNTCDLSFSLSNVNLSIPSEADTVNTGIKRETVTVIKSDVPYSAVDKQLVYKGTRKKVDNFVEKAPIVIHIVFFPNFEYLLSFTLYSPFKLLYIFLNLSVPLSPKNDFVDSLIYDAAVFLIL